MKKKTIILFFAVGIMVSFAGCQAIKKVFIKPPPEGIIQESYPVRVYAYQSSVVVKATPHEVITHIVKDFSWLERASQALSGLQMEVQDLKAGVDMTEVGQSIDFNIKVLLIDFPCRLVTFKYKTDKELWLMIITDGTWVLLRYKVKPVPEGSMLNTDVLIKLSPALEKIVGFSQFSDAVAGRIDLIMAFIQSEFDPDLDVNKVTEKGLRGELYEAFLQAHEASIWVDAGPEKVAQWIINNLDSLGSEIRIKGDCPSYRVYAELSEGQVRHCPASIEFGKLSVDVNTFLIWKVEGKERIYRLYFQGLGQMGIRQFGITPEAGGSRVEDLAIIEIPGSASPRIMEIMMSFAAIPKRMGEVLWGIKQGVEGIG